MILTGKNNEAITGYVPIYRTLIPLQVYARH